LKQRGSQIEEIATCRCPQDAQCPDEGQAAPGGFTASVGIIQQKLIGLNLLREGNGFPFSWR
jgi:hypothetical protein